MLTAPNPVTPTERAVAAMLVENTGSHFLDSGIYGRAWQMTRARFGLDAGLPNSSWDGSAKRTHEPDTTEIDQVAAAMREDETGSIDSFGTIYVNTFHWLVARLTFDPALHAKWRRWSDKDEAHQVALNGRYSSERHSWSEQIELFVEKLREHGAHVEIETHDNSYNHDCELDRTIQYLVFTVSNPSEFECGYLTPKGHSSFGDPVVERPRREYLPDGTYCLLQIHGGADVRGGYTAPVLFDLGYEWSDLLDYNRAEVWCDGADLVRDGQAPGQIKMEAEILEAERVSHVWDNGYGDGRFRRYDHEIGDQVNELLVLPDREEERDELIEKGVIDTSYDPRRPMIFKANVARKDDENVWRCPFDGSPLHVSGATVG